ncbi:type II toxin-antitoxin system HicA family toxin [Clostridiaceae bacterium]|nr:type II toxin-antitoxin system HicA family toxin [Clostridiaceae bacterium]RKI14399.1 type II toxin-antitoxin system HicA family toxin [bacterium 1XD21-70]
MATIEKLYLSILSGMQDKNIKFRDLQKLLNILGFECRIKGDHFIYSYSNLPENINIQPSGNMAKPYQVKQIRTFLQKYQLKL